MCVCVCVCVYVYIYISFKPAALNTTQTEFLVQQRDASNRAYFHECTLYICIYIYNIHHSNLWHCARRKLSSSWGNAVSRTASHRIRFSAALQVSSCIQVNVYIQVSTCIQINFYMQVSSCIQINLFIHRSQLMHTSPLMYAYAYI